MFDDRVKESEGTTSIIVADERQSARRSFIENLPPRDVIVSLCSRSHESIGVLVETVANSSLSFFSLLGIVSPADCARLVEYLGKLDPKEDSNPLEDIADTPPSDAHDIAEAALRSLGPENLRSLATSLVHIEPDSDESTDNIKMKALSGIKLASALPLAQIGSIFTEYSNLARLRTDSYDGEMLRLLAAGVQTFSRAFFDAFSDQQLVPLNLNVSQGILEDLTVFVRRHQTHPIRTPLDDSNKGGIATSLQITRRKAEEERIGDDLIRQLDQLMDSLGYKYDPSYVGGLGAYVPSQT